MELDTICLAVRKMQLMGASTLQELKQEAEQLFGMPSGQVRGCSTDARDHSAWCMQVTAVILDDDEDRGTEITSNKLLRGLVDDDRSVRLCISMESLRRLLCLQGYVPSGNCSASRGCSVG